MFIAIPVLDEAEHLPRLLECLNNQRFNHFHVYICVNQPDEWWEDPEKISVCRSDVEVLRNLEAYRRFSLTAIDCCSRGKGWKGKRHGVGFARKTIMDAISKVASGNDFIISLDADTTFGDNYLSSVAENFRNNPEAVAIAVPYYHRLTTDPEADRAILRYEIYMRNYSLNLWRIGSPYTFTALGSAMAVSVRAYRATGGITPRMSGEDFYFLQKLRKYGKILFTNPEKVYPAARFSSRVYFGTGPAMIRGRDGDWTGYPVYSYKYFDEIKATTDLFQEFYQYTSKTPVTEFMAGLFHEEDPFLPLRENFKSISTFIRSCNEKFDALRILQYLKSRQGSDKSCDEENLIGFLKMFYPDEYKVVIPDEKQFSFRSSDISQLDNVRNFLVRKEEEYQLTSIPQLQVLRPREE